MILVVKLAIAKDAQYRTILAEGRILNISLFEIIKNQVLITQKAYVAKTVQLLSSIKDVFVNCQKIVEGINCLLKVVNFVVVKDVIIKNSLINPHHLEVVPAINLQVRANIVY